MLLPEVKWLQLATGCSAHHKERDGRTHAHTRMHARTRSANKTRTSIPTKLVGTKLKRTKQNPPRPTGQHGNLRSRLMDMITSLSP